MSGGVVIVQARMGSTRLPGKILKDIGGVPLLLRCVTGLAVLGCPVVVATSDRRRDDVVEERMRREGVACFRGDEQDVLDRFCRAAEQYGAEAVVRATGDNPFPDAEEGRRVLDGVLSGGFDYVHMLGPRCGLPKGTGLEAISVPALMRSRREGLAPHHREHVNEFILENPGQFRMAELQCPDHKRCPELNLSVDTHEELEFVRGAVAALEDAGLPLTTENFVRWYREGGHAGTAR